MMEDNEKLGIGVDREKNEFRSVKRRRKNKTSRFIVWPHRKLTHTNKYRLFFQYAMCTLSSSNLTTSESIENLIQSV